MAPFGSVSHFSQAQAQKVKPVKPILIRWKWLHLAHSLFTHSDSPLTSTLHSLRFCTHKTDSGALKQWLWRRFWKGILLAQALSNNGYEEGFGKVFFSHRCIWCISLKFVFFWFISFIFFFLLGWEVFFFNFFLSTLTI